MKIIITSISFLLFTTKALAHIEDKKENMVYDWRGPVIALVILIIAITIARMIRKSK